MGGTHSIERIRTRSFVQQTGSRSIVDNETNNNSTNDNIINTTNNAEQSSNGVIARKRRRRNVAANDNDDDDNDSDVEHDDSRVRAAKSKSTAPRAPTKRKLDESLLPTRSKRLLRHADNDSPSTVATTSLNITPEVKPQQRARSCFFNERGVQKLPYACVCGQTFRISGVAYATNALFCFYIEQRFAQE
jgi:hypothetical protein